MNKDAKIFVAGHRGLVGSALVRELTRQGYANIITRTRHEVDLLNRGQVCNFFAAQQPECVFLAAAHVGGIKDNAADPLGFFLDNMDIERNVIMAAVVYNVKKLVFLGSSCIYPRNCPQPIKEEYLLTGAFEKTTEAYGLAKVAGVKLCEWLYKQGHDFVAAMPCNIFGPGDRVDAERAHVIPGLIARLHAAKLRGDKEFFVWGDGTAKREVLYSDDLARALIMVMDRYSDSEPINTGSSFELTIAGLARIIAGVVGYTGRIKFDPSQPVGTPRKVLDNTKIMDLGWQPAVPFVEALQRTYEDFKSRVG